MTSAELLPIEKLMMTITTKADRNPSGGYGMIAICSRKYIRLPIIAAKSLLCVQPPSFEHEVTDCVNRGRVYPGNLGTR